VDASQADLIALHRSTAMLSPGNNIGVERDLLLSLLDELIAQRALLHRLGADLRTVAQRSRAATDTWSNPAK
jgi:hypothetical protein